jgi:FtsP/CotA-like multicopper oxidase with cupredoxin domain
VQRWRLVGATAFTPLLLSIGGDLPSPAMVQIAQDGVTFAAPVRTAEVPLAMGGRADVLIRADRPGTYELRAHGQPKPLMTIEVAGDRIEPPMRFPAKLPPGKPPLDEAEIAEVSVHREVVWHVDRGVFPAPFPNAYRILGTHPTPMADPSGDPKTDPKYGRFDPGFVNHTLRRGAVERWTIRTDEQMPSLFHPFHLHTNHVLVTHRNGKKLDPPVWHDTIGIPGGKPGDSVTFLVKYEDFVGRAVLHCHLLAHEDLGMMQIVEYVP